MKTTKKLFAAALIAAILPTAGASAFFGFGGNSQNENSEKPKIEIIEEKFAEIVALHKLRKEMDAIREKIDAAIEAEDFGAFKIAHEEMQTFRNENADKLGKKFGGKFGKRGGKFRGGNRGNCSFGNLETPTAE